jgi:hypothetical protein
MLAVTNARPNYDCVEIIEPDIGFIIDERQGDLMSLLFDDLP